MSEVTILACDPGYERLGWAIGTRHNSQQLKVLAYGCLRTSAQAPLLTRFEQLYHQLSELTTQYQPHQLAIETLYFSRNQSTALAVSEVRGLLFGLAFQHHLSITQYTPAEIKLAATGYGKADKAAVRKMVELQLKLQVSAKEVDDTLDALALLLTHHVSQKVSV
jgi:crossover junction endodeoxyribonuclease RuvC